MARPGEGTYTISGRDMAAVMADALEAGAISAENSNVGSVAAQDWGAAVEAGKQAATGMSAQDVYAAALEEGDAGMISQGSAQGAVIGMGDQGAALTDAQKQAGSSKGYVTSDKLQTHAQMYPDHRKMADAVGAGGLGFFTKNRTEMINNNKSQMRAMGIEPSHRNNAGELTGRYSSGDWKAFVAAMGGGNIATEAGDDEDEMEVIIDKTISEAEQTQPYTGMTQDIQATIPMPGPQATQGYGGYDPFPPGQDFSWPNTPPPGMNIPGTPVQEDLGTGYASEQVNMGMAEPLGQGNMPLTEERQMGMAAPLGAGGNVGSYIEQSQMGMAPPLGQGNMVPPEQRVMGIAPPLGSGGDPGAYAPSYGQEMFGGQSQPWVSGQRPTPSNFEQASLWRSGSFPVYGPQASGDSYNRMGGSLSSAPPGGSRTAGGTPVNYESIVGHPRMYNLEGTESGNIGPYGSRWDHGEMDEGTLDPNAGLIARGTEADNRTFQQRQLDRALEERRIIADTVPGHPSGRDPVRVGWAAPTGNIESITKSIETIADKPIADGTDATELIKNNTSSGGSHESRVEDLVKAGVPQTLTNLMEDSAVAMLHFVLAQLVADHPNEKITFNDLIPYIQKMNLSEGNALSVFP